MSGNVRIVRIALIVAAVALGVLAAAATWEGLDPRALPIEAAGATAATVLAGTCWLAYDVRDRDKDALVRALADLSLRRGLARTQPLKRVV